MPAVWLWSISHDAPAHSQQRVTRVGYMWPHPLTIRNIIFSIVLICSIACPICICICKWNGLRERVEGVWGGKRKTAVSWAISSSKQCQKNDVVFIVVCQFAHKMCQSKLPVSISTPSLHINSFCSILYLAHTHTHYTLLTCVSWSPFHNLATHCTAS